MSTTYKLCILLIRKGKLAGLKAKLDAYLAADRLTIDEYNELMDKIAEKEG